MRMSEPDWDEVDMGLRAEPFRSRMFTPELAAGVREGIAGATGGRRSMRPARLSLMLAVGVASTVCAAIVLIGGGLDNWGARDPGRESAAANGGRLHAVSGVVPPVWAGDRPALPVRVPQDSQWQALIDESYPDMQTSMLHKSALREDVMLVLSRRLLEAEGYLSFSLVVDEFVWGKEGWKSQARVGYHPGDNLLEAGDKKLLTGWSGISLDPQDSGQFVTMFYGVVADPAIVDIRVTDDGGRVHAAGVHDAGDGYAYWFAPLPPGEKGSYTVEGAAADGKLLYEEFFYYR